MALMLSQIRGQLDRVTSCMKNPVIQTMKLSSAALAAVLVLAACGNPDNTAAQEGAFPEPNAFGDTQRVVPGDTNAVKTSFAPVASAAGPAVVNISAVSSRRADPFWEMFTGQAQRQASSIGSGVIVRSDGVVVTNNHVIQGAQQITVTLADRREFRARVLIGDQQSDIAVLQLEGVDGGLPVLPIDDQEQHQVGDLVLAIGNPFGVGQTVTNGIISALNRTNTGISDASSFIQTDAAINPGNSGGALVDMDGDLIGINTAIFSRSGTSAGVGFAVPASTVRQVLDSALGGADAVIRPWLGVRAETVTSDIARSLGMSRPQGVLVATLYPGGPGERAGIREGDIITAVDGAEVNDASGLNFRVGSKRPGERAQISLLRDGRAQTVNATVQPLPGERDAQQVMIERGLMSGALVADYSPALAQAVGGDIYAGGQGVLVVNLSGRGYAARAGFRRGDIVREINGRAVRNVAELQQALNSAGRWDVTIERGGQRITGRFG